MYALADKWSGYLGGRDNDFKPQPNDIKDWSANQIVVFLERVLAFPSPLPTERAQQMGETYSLKQTQNVEISSRFFQVALAAGDSTVKDLVTEMLGKVGRMKFVRPLYRSLIAYGDVDLAVETFEKNKDFYRKSSTDIHRRRESLMLFVRPNLPGYGGQATDGDEEDSLMSNLTSFES